MARKLSVILFLLLITTGAFASKYRYDKAGLDALFSTAVENHFVSQAAALPNLMHPGAVASTASSKQLTAGLIAAVEFVTGVGWLIPFHRIYLGTSFLVIAAYCCTGSGFGILLVCDGIFCLLNPDGDQYVDNDRIFMWL